MSALVVALLAIFVVVTVLALPTTIQHFAWLRRQRRRRRRSQLLVY